jgi:elongation factor P
LPPGIPGIGLEIDGAMQHAPQSVRHSMAVSMGVAVGMVP